MTQIILFAKRLGALLMLATIFLSACSEIPVQPVDEKISTTEAGYGSAFGRIAYVEDGKEKDFGTSIFSSDWLTVFIRSVQTGQMQYMEIKGNGSFFWPLKAGEYVIVGYQAVHRMGNNEQSAGRLWTTFSVPQPGQAVYIGDLRIETGKARYRFYVDDQYAEALKRSESLLAAGKLEAVKGLMRLEEQIGKYKQVTSVCNQDWGINCDKNYHGVEPLRPEGTADGFPVTENLTPLFKWKPSSKLGITYDVAIFESLTFTFGMAGSVPRMDGALVAYAEGLSEPQFLLASPLQSGKKYIWQVRLRDGDTVSTWSTTSHFVFAIVAWASRSGQGFGFTTPSK